MVKALCATLALAAMCSLAGCNITSWKDANAQAEDAPSFTRTDFMKDLQSPWDLAFTKNNVLFFTEKCRGLSVRLPGGEVRRLFGTEGSATVAKDIFCRGQSGVNGVALDPDFENNRQIYVYTLSNLDEPDANRVVRLTVNSDFTNVSNRQDIITGIAFKSQRTPNGSAGAHSGGRIRFGPDGYLYIPTGDNHNGKVPQDLSSLGGKVLRVTRDGKPAPNNNTPQGGDPRIFTYGHRNVQGLTFHPKTGVPYIAEHGPNHSDEVTRLVAGGNGGWDPAPEAGVQCPDNYCGYGSNNLEGELTPMTDTEKFENAMPPIWNNDGESDGLGPAHFIVGKKWQQWDGRVLLGMMATEKVKILKLDENNAVASEATVDLPSARVRSIVQDPNGDIYMATDQGEIWRIAP